MLCIMQRSCACVKHPVFLHACLVDWHPLGCCTRADRVDRPHAWSSCTQQLREGMLSVCQRELGRVLYPVFLHTCLDLVDQGAAAAAAALMARHRRRFTEAGGRTSKLRMQVPTRSCPPLCPPPPPHSATSHRQPPASRSATVSLVCHEAANPMHGVWLSIVGIASPSTRMGRQAYSKQQHREGFLTLCRTRLTWAHQGLQCSRACTQMLLQRMLLCRRSWRTWAP